MSLSIDPKFQAWYNKRKIAQRTGTDIPTRNANPTRTAGPKNSNGPKRGSSKTSVTVPRNSNGKGTKTVASPVVTNVKKTGVVKPARKSSVGRPKGKVRATNHPKSV